MSDFIPFTYKTKSMQEAATLLTQDLFNVEYLRLDPIEGKVNKFKFVFKLNTNQETFTQYKTDYINRKLRIEPKKYDESLNILRDNLAIAKN